MSQARVYVTAKVRKDWTCGKCGAAIRKGIDGRRSFAVGFRGREQTRCMKPECTPTREELESSAVAPVYGAIDNVDMTNFDSVEEFKDALQEVADACREVADEYESNEMYEINEQLQERAEMLNTAADELEGWEPDDADDPGTEIECEECEGHGTIQGDEGDEVDCKACKGTGYLPDEEASSARDEWLETVRDSAQEILDGLELP